METDRSAETQELSELLNGYSLQGGAVGGGVQWMGAALYNKTAYNIM